MSDTQLEELEVNVVSKKRPRSSSTKDLNEVRKKRRLDYTVIEVNEDESYQVSLEEEQLSKYIGDWVPFFLPSNNRITGGT